MSGSIPVNALAPGAAFQNQPQIAAPVNPLALAGQAQQFQQNQLAVQSSQQQLAARQAVGAAYQQATDPTTGATDYGKLQGLIASDPNAAWIAPQVTQQIQEQQKRGFDLQQQQLTQTQNRQNVFSGALAPLLAEGDNMKPSDVIGTMTRLNAAGFPIDGAVKQFMATAPTDGPGLHQWALQTFGAGLPAAVQASTFLPAPKLADVGGTLQGYDSNPVTNANASSMTLGKTLDPAGQVKQVPGTPNAAGGATVIPQSSFAQNQGLGGLVPGAPSAFGNVRSGGLPSALVNPNGPPPRSGAGVAGAGDPSAFGAAGGDPSSGAGGAPAPMTVGLGPGQSAGLAAAGAASAKQWSDLQAQVGGTAAGGGSAGRIYQLQSAVGDLQALGPNGSGAGSDTWNNLKSYFNTIPGISSVIGFDPNTISNYNMANKALTNYAAARAGAHGGTTDSQLATTLSSQASTHISNLAATQVAQANIGLERMDQAQASAFAATGQSPDQFSNFSARWNASQDPRAYVADQLPPQKVVALVNSMSPTDRAKFENTYTTGIRNGWITPPAWAQSAPPAAGAAPSTADIATNPGGAPTVAPAAGMTPGGY